ncbi:MAG: hypothetical protein AB7K85_13675 [Novosphingobium sp.]
MSLKAPIEVRSFKSGKITVHTAAVADVATADFVGGSPKILRVMNGAVKAVFVRQGGGDLREVNRARQGLKEPEFELTTAKPVDVTR